MLTDRKPRPRPDGRALASALPKWPAVTRWPRQVPSPEADFLTVLTARRSSAGGTLSEPMLAAVLRHSTMLRSRRADGRFGVWESRTAPAAGGLHGISMLVLPFEPEGVAGVYDPDRHALLAPGPLEEAMALNREQVTALVNATGGCTVQFMADRRRYEACYEAAGSLIWRDAGALSAIISLVATLFSLRSCILGRHGSDVLVAAGLSDWIGVGGVHLGS